MKQYLRTVSDLGIELRLEGGRKLLVRRTDDPIAKDILGKFAAATKTPGRMQALRFFFIRHSYLRPWSNLPILLVYWISGHEGRESQLTASASYAQQIGGLQVAKIFQLLRPLIQKRFIGPFVTSLLRRRQRRRVKKDEVVQEEIYLAIIGLISKDVLSATIADAVKELGPYSYQLAADLGRSIAGWGAANLAQRARLMDAELGLTEKSAGEFYQSLVELDAVRPLATFAWCLNPTCRHWEVTLSDRLLKHERCPKCGEPVFSAITMVVDPQLGLLKTKDRDLTSFLAELTNLNSRMELVGSDLTPSIQAFSNVSVKSHVGKDEREVDLLLYSPLTRKSCAVECKIHEDAHKILPGTWESVCTSDLRQLGEIVDKTGITQAALITNLRLTENHVQTIQETILPKIGLRKETTEILSFTDEASFLSSFEKLLQSLDQKTDVSESRPR